MDTENFLKLREVHPQLDLGPQSDYVQRMNPGGPKGDEPGKGGPGGWVHKDAVVHPTAYVAFNSVVMDKAVLAKDSRVLQQSSVQQGAHVGIGTTVAVESSVPKGMDLAPDTEFRTKHAAVESTKAPSAFEAMQSVHKHLELGPEKDYVRWVNPGGKEGNEPGKGAPGGFVHLGAKVDPTAYIAQDAVVMDGAMVGRSARIMNRSSVQEGANVGQMSTLGVESSVPKRQDVGDFNEFSNGPGTPGYRKPESKTVVAAKHVDNNHTADAAAHAMPHVQSQHGMDQQKAA